MLRPDAADKAAGFAALDALASSPLAGADDLRLLTAVNANAGLNELEGDYREEVDKRVAVKPYLVQAAKLRKTVNDRLGVPTSPVTEKIAALARDDQFTAHITANGHVGPGTAKP